MGNKSNISIFKKIKETHKPISSMTMDEALNYIQSNPSQSLIEIARKSGKNKPKEIQNGFLFSFFDDIKSSIKDNAFIAQIDTLLATYNNQYVIVVSDENQLEFAKSFSVFSKWQCKFKSVNNITEFFETIENKDLTYAFIDAVWIRDAGGDKNGRIIAQLKNLYEYIKGNYIPCCTWNCEIANSRSIKNIVNTSGYIYMDVDDFDGKTFSEVKNILCDKNLTFVKAVWKSFGGDGLGFLIHIDELTIDNFKTSWIFYAKKIFDDLGIKIDKATKDISRINVMSYDPDIFIRETTTPLVAITERYDVDVVKTTGVPHEMYDDTISYLLNLHYNSPDSFNKKENRLSYHFYQRFFSHCNRYGITVEAVIAYLESVVEQYPAVLNNKSYDKNRIFGFAYSQYEAYASQFGEIEIKPNTFKIAEGYKIVGLYKKYEGDIDLKIRDILSFLDKNDDKFYFKLATRTKRVGIKMTDLMDFINENIGYDPKNSLVVKQIYVDNKYPFGLVTVLTPEHKEKTLSAFINKKLTDGFIQIIEEIAESEYEKVLDQIYNDTILIHKKVNRTNIINVCKTFFGKANTFGIPKDTAIAYLKEASTFDAISRYAVHYGNEIYTNSKLYHGIRFIKKISTKDIENRYNITKQYTLPNNQKLSSLNLDLDDYTILWADTNMGKTTWICNYMYSKRIVLVPVIGALKNIEEKYGASVYYEDKKNVKPEDDLIVCTYSSFPNLFNLIQTWDGGAGEWELYFDEEHNFAVSAEKEYRNVELNSILDNIDRFKKRILLTGTLFPILHPTIKQFKIVRVKWQEQPTKKYEIIHFENKLDALEKNLDSEGKNIIYFQNKKEHGGLGELVSYLKMKGWDKIAIINADTKDSEDFKNLISTELLSDEVDIIICTSVIIEAINILNENVAALHFLTFENPILLEQMANRTRVRLPERILIYKKNKKEEKNIENLDIIKFQQGMVNEANNLLKFLTIPKNKSEHSYTAVAVQKLIMSQIFEKSELFRVKNGEWVVDYLSIANKAFEKEKQLAYADGDYLQVCLAQYGWEHVGNTVYTKGMDKQTKDEIKALTEEKKAEFDEYCLEVLLAAKSEGIDSIKDIMKGDKSIFNGKKHPDVEWDIRIKILKFHKYMSFEDAVNLTEQWIVEDKMSDKSYRVYMRQIAVKVVKAVDGFNSKVKLDNDFTKLVYQFYNSTVGKNEYYTKEDLVKVFDGMKRVNKNLVELDGKKFAIQIFEKYFEVIPVLHKGELVYSIGGLNPTNDVTLFTKALYGWADDCMQAEKVLTSDEIAVHLNEIREQLPILKMFMLNSNKAIRLLRDYVTIKETTKRDGKKTIKCYRITELEPKETKNYTIFVNQSVKIDPTINKDIREIISKQTVQLEHSKF